MPDRVPKAVLIGAAATTIPLLACLAFFRPGYFTSSTYLGGLVFAEFLFVALWFYRRVFFPLVTLSFLFAGIDVPFSGPWVAARWVVLLVGALVGTFILLKDRSRRFGLFHALAMFAMLAGLVSAVVCRYPTISLLKAISLLLLFLYATTGVRVAVLGRENSFFHGLLIGCEIFVVLITVFYGLGREVMGNPNSLGAVMGVAVAPILLWGTLLEENIYVHHRRQILYAIAMYLTFHSHSRAGLAAALVSSMLMCLFLRRYKLLGQGIVIVLIIAAASAIFAPDEFSKTMTSLTDTVIYKGKDPSLGVLGSRQTPWEEAMDSIHKHFWFGSGFGITDNGEDQSRNLDAYGSFATSADLTSENGSSYLTIVTWVGMAGVLPFAFLLLALLGKVLRTVIWMLNTGDARHPAIPLAMVMIAGFISAGFEDWLFAVGYYLCVFFWCLAFILDDIAPYAPLPRFSLKLHSSARERRDWANVATGQ
jgi:O-antigen ligase